MKKRKGREEGFNLKTKLRMDNLKTKAHDGWYIICVVKKQKILVI